MRSTEFPEQTKVLRKPAGWTDEQCIPLSVHCDGRECISRWEPTLRERIALIFGAPVWLRVVFGETQPPVALHAKRTIFRKEPRGSARPLWWKQLGFQDAEDFVRRQRGAA